MLLRCRLPGGVITTNSGRRSINLPVKTPSMAAFADQPPDVPVPRHSEKERQTGDQMLHSVGLDALATANDMNRTCCALRTLTSRSCTRKHMNGEENL